MKSGEKEGCSPSVDANATGEDALEALDHLRTTLLECLEETLKLNRKRGSGATSWKALCQRCGMDYSHFMRYVKGDRWQNHLPADDLFRLMLAAELEPEQVFWSAYRPYFQSRMQALLERAGSNNFGPLVALRLARNGGRPAEDEHLRFLSFMLGHDLPNFSWPSDFSIPLDSEVARIDDLREQDRDRALEEATSWLRDCEERLQASNPSQQDMARFCMALGVWASAQRFFGRMLLASVALEAALSMHGAASLSPSYADLCVRAAHIVRELGQPALGLPLIVSAVPVFQLSRDIRSHGRALIGVGVLAKYAGDTRLALSAWEDCTRIKGISDPLRRDALVNLAYVQIEQGHCREADTVLLSALQTNPPPRAHTKLIWRRAVAQAGLSKAKARMLFERAIPLAIEHLEPPDPFFVFQDYCDFLRAQDDHETIVRHALSLVPQLERLDPQNLLARGAAANFLTAAQNSFHASSYRDLTRAMRDAFQR